MIASLLLVGTLLQPAKLPPAIDTPWYFSPAARDSAALYRGHVEAYHQEFYSYDWAMTGTMIPVFGGAVGGYYVDKSKTGIVYSAAELVSVAATTYGFVRFVAGKRTPEFNVGLIAGGILSYIGIKWLEIRDFQHTVSERNEALVEKWGVKEADITPGSIRYPRREWPNWITKGPEPRDPQDSREVIDKPLPTVSK